MSNRDLSKTKKATHWFRFGGVDIGYITPDSLNINQQLTTETLEVDQIENEAARVEYNALIPAVTFTCAQDSVELIYNTILKNLAGFRAGSNGQGAYGSGDILEDAKIHAAPLEIVPTKWAGGDRKDSFYIPLAYLTEQTLTQVMGKNTWGSFPIEFGALPDPDAPAKFRYMVSGNIDASGVAPNGIVLSPSPLRPNPSKTMQALTLGPDAYDYLNAWLFYGDESAEAATVNGALTATATTIPYNAGSISIQVDDIIDLNGNEYCYVVANDTDLNNLTVIRGVNGKAATSHLDTDSIYVMNDPYYWPGTRLVDWLSSDPTKVYVGDSLDSISDQTQKGRITNIGNDDATANITATMQAVTSETLVATAGA